MAPPANRIRELRTGAGLSQQQLGDLVGTNRQQIMRLEKGKRRLTHEWMAKIADALGRAPAELIATRDGAGVARIRELQAANRETGGGVAMSKVRELDVGAGAGNGAIHEEERVVANWSIPTAMLEGRASATIDDLRIITVRGDSMEPTLMPGTKVVVDSADRIPSPGGVFVLWDGFGLVVKRLEMLPHSDPPRARVTSDNERYDSYEVDQQDAHVQGRVVGRWRWM